MYLAGNQKFFKCTVCPRTVDREEKRTVSPSDRAYMNVLRLPSRLLYYVSFARYFWPQDLYLI